MCCPNVLTLETPSIVSSPFVTTRPFSLRNNLVKRAIELLKSFAGSYSTYKYFFFSDDLNLNLNSLRIWLLTLFHIKHIFHSLNHEIYFSIRNSRHTMLPYSCHVTLICPIRTPFTYEVVSQRKCPSIKISMEVYAIQTCGVILNHIEHKICSLRGIRYTFDPPKNGIRSLILQLDSPTVFIGKMNMICTVFLNFFYFLSN